MTQSSGHDPLCPTNQNDDPNCWFCEHNAKVRADEHKRVMEFCCEDTEKDIRERIAEAVRGTEFWDALATEIRRVDGNHTLGAAAMAEELVPFIAAAIARKEKP